MFDGFNLARRMNAGEYIPDGVGDLLGGLFRNKIVATVVLGILAIAFLSHLLGFAISIIASVLPLLFVLAILYIIFRK